MKTEHWIKKLGGTAGEHYVAAELSKRGIPNALLPENFSDNDIILGGKNGKAFGYIQVKSCHPDRANTFRLNEKNEAWVNAKDNEYVVFVWLGSQKKQNSHPAYWIARKKDVGAFCIRHRPKEPSNTERRYAPDEESKLVPKTSHPRIPKEWRTNGWDMFSEYMPASDSASK